MIWQKWVGRIWVFLTVLLCLASATWRCTFYWRIPVCKGDPYGLGDILEGLLYVGAFGSAALGAIVITVVAIFKPQARRRCFNLIGALALLLAATVFLQRHLPCDGTNARGKLLWTC